MPTPAHVTNLREHAEEARQAHERLMEKQAEEATIQSYQDKIVEAQNAANEQLTGLPYYEGDFRVEEDVVLLELAESGITLLYEPETYTEWGRMRGEFYLAEKDEASGYWDRGYQQVGGRLKDPAEVLVTLGYALQAGVPHPAKRDDDGDAPRRVTDGEIAASYLQAASDLLRPDDKLEGSQVIPTTLLAIAWYLRELGNVIGYVGGER